jgi:Holliday junction resolvasome RuvABC endonuclease subunit
MKITGLDLSITAPGICTPDGAAYTLKTSTKTGDRRLQAIRDAVHKAVVDADMAVLEEAPPGLRGNAIKAIHMVQGAVRLELLDLCVPYAVVNPSTLKLFATGTKGADKVKMATTALKLAGLEFEDDNACDAWWLRQAGLAHYGLSELRIPAAQLRTLEAVVWP